MYLKKFYFTLSSKIDLKGKVESKALFNEAMLDVLELILKAIKK